MNGRRMVRWTVRVLGVILAVALAVLLLARVYGSRRLAAAQRDFVNRVGPEGPVTTTPVKFSDERNAALFLRAGAEAMILPGDDKPQMGEMTIIPLSRWTTRDQANLRRILKNNGPALELLHRAAGMAESNFGHATSGSRLEDSMTGYLLKLLSAQRVLFVDARMALLEHASARLLTDAASMATMASGLERETPMVELLAGMACEKMLLSTVGEALADPSTDLETLTKLQGMLIGTDLRAAWRASNLWQQAVIEKHVAAVMGDPLAARAQEAGLYGRFMEFAFGDLFRAQQLEIRADLIAAVDQPLGLDPPWSRRGVRRPRTVFDMFDVFESVMFGPTAKSSIGRVQSTLSLRRLARIAVELRLQGLETGAYPETLASLPGATQPDPFAGKPLTYERRRDGSARLSVPDFGALWTRISDIGPGAQPFVWELPAPHAMAAK